MKHKVFWCESTGEANYYLRRYSLQSDCVGRGKYHSAHIFWERGPIHYDKEQHKETGRFYETTPRAPMDAPWPKNCEYCGYKFVEQVGGYDPDPCHVLSKRIYRRTDTNEEIEEGSWPIGAMWDEWWLPSRMKGFDGIALTVQTPGGPWNIDSRCSNCTMPDDIIHKCWVRHGDPKTGQVHVDKNGNTCSAGGGSIVCGGYHGFLHNGYLTDC